MIYRFVCVTQYPSSDMSSTSRENLTCIKNFPPNPANIIDQSFEASRLPNFSNLQNLQICQKKKLQKKFKFSGLMVSKLYTTLITWILFKLEEPGCYTFTLEEKISAETGSTCITMVLPVPHPRLIPPIALHTSRGRYLIPETIIATPRWWKKNWPFGGGM